MQRALSAVLIFLTLAASGSANEDLSKTLLTVRGKLLVSEDFSASSGAAAKDPKHWKQNWHFAVGKWEATDGVLKGTEVPQDQHPAHAAFNLDFVDAVVECDARLDVCRMTRIRITDDADYVCSMRMTPAGFALYKDDHDHTGPDKDELLGKVERPLAAGEWHRLMFEIRGNEVVATLDGKSIAGSHPLIGNAKKSLRFAVVGGSASYRRLRVWDALPNPDWSKSKPLLSVADQPASATPNVSESK